MLEREDPNPRAETKARRGAPPPGGSAKDYPFQPELEGRTELLEGLEKLRGVRDRATAQMLYELHFAAEANQNDRDFWRERDRERARREAAEFASLKALAERCLRGGHGDEAKDLALHMLHDGRQYRTDRRSLEEFAAALRRLRRGLA